MHPLHARGHADDKNSADGAGVGDSGTESEEEEDGEGSDKDDNNSTSHPADHVQDKKKNRKRILLPQWLVRLFDKLVGECRNCNDLGQPPLYYKHGTFWFPRKSTWFMLQNLTVTPDDLFNPQFFLWDPKALCKIPCPNCKTELQRHMHISRPRRVVSFNSTFWMIGFQYRCGNCSRLKPASKNITFRSWNSCILAALPRALAAEFPARLSHRGAMYISTVEWMRSSFQNGMGSKQFSDSLRTQHLLRYDKLHLHERVTERGPTAIIQVAYESQVYILQRACNSKTEFCGAVDLSTYAHERFISLPSRNLSLSDLCASVLGRCLPKNVPERVGTDWENKKLTDAQLKYAACDAHVALAIYSRLSLVPVPSPIAPAAPLPLAGTSVLVFNSDKKQPIARGRIARPPQSGILDGMAMKPGQLAVEIQNIMVPGAILPSHQDRPLSSFGPPPFPIIMNRANVCVQQSFVVPSAEPNPTSPTVLPGKSQQRQSVDSEPIPMRPPGDHELPDIPAETEGPAQDSAESLASIIFALLDGGHSSPTSASAHEVDGIALQEGLEILVKQIIPPPDLLYLAVAQVFKTYSPLKDAKTNAPLFNKEAWKTAKQVLELIYNGFLSDPAGIPLYVVTGIGAKTGLPLYRCFRGTNSTEGGVHTHLRSHLPSSESSIQHALACLKDFVLHHNLLVGTLNGTGQKYKGHFSIWITNQIQQYTIALQDWIQTHTDFSNWLNTDFYETSGEVIGVLPITPDMQLANSISPYVEGYQDLVRGSASAPPARYEYLVRLQRTRKAVVPVHTEKECELFHNLMKESPDFKTSLSGNPNWNKVVIVWNQIAEIKEGIYYKVCSQLHLCMYIPNSRFNSV
ncbi:hypothetical protein DFP72DRAFT_831643 [Ephemerocybe angulata]|uniref:3'-5' exonuclease domain-containing protein n=1 Tax=Ephemerocybe angulata TaxID=980116 RepID=A0A8H6H8W3_9AGAR|nr:hypothetical protein DFP72DRAFT_831643 [Tulosesus angulatus]